MTAFAFSTRPLGAVSPRRLLDLALTVLMVGLAIYFVRHEGPELAQAVDQLPQTPPVIALAALVVTGLYVLLSALMYVGSFAATGARVGVGTATRLWLRRNFISVFLPAGGVSSMAFYNRSLRQHMTDEQLYAGSLVYVVAGYGSLLLVALPVLALGVGRELLGPSALYSVATLLTLFGLGYYVVASFRRQGRVFRLLRRYAPAFSVQLEPLLVQRLASRPLLLTLAASVGIELCGLAHVALALAAVGAHPTLALALTAYVVATLLYALSPVLRGLGAVELSLTVVLTRLGGLSTADAVAATLYYRLFEFWLPLGAGLYSFVWQRGNLLLRVLPAFLTILLGVVNILSALTPAISHRLRWVEGLLPAPLVVASTYAVLLAGVALLLLSLGLIRGYRLAWWLTVGMVAVSIITHLTKAADYEEALFAGLVLAVLLYTQAHYRLVSPSARRLASLRRQSVQLLPTDADWQTAQQLTAQYGRSALDYFKLYPDKALFIPAPADAFVAYRRAGLYAVALEGPVGPPTAYAATVRAFDAFCRRRGWRTLYYRVDEADLPQFNQLRKKSLLIGQEGLVNLGQFTLEGRDRKSLRNALKRVESAGFVTRTYQPPLRDGLVQQLRAVSDEWLRAEGLHESTFAQGRFRAAEIKQQTVVTVENTEGKVVAFANIVPDYAPGEGTYDLIRKTDDAPSGVTDALMVGLIAFGQGAGWQWLNLGLAPLSGLEQAQKLPEQALRLAYERLRAFAHFKGLRAFKEKYADTWQNKYLVYGEELDLLQTLRALQQVSHAPNQ